jgi:hypothetical protein
MTSSTLILSINRPRVFLLNLCFASALEARNLSVLHCLASNLSFNYLMLSFVLYLSLFSMRG